MVHLCSEFQNHLDHARAAYQFAIRSLPDPACLEDGLIQVSGCQFESRTQIESMLIELGWAFFCRYESCLEAEIKRQDVKLNRKLSLIDWLKQNNVHVPDALHPGLQFYRQIRNQLHHEDGASLDGEPNREIHLMPEHMERFYKLFSWCGQRLACAG